jgi:hypothetical protein
VHCLSLSVGPADLLSTFSVLTDIHLKFVLLLHRCVGVNFVSVH